MNLICKRENNTIRKKILLCFLLTMISIFWNVSDSYGMNEKEGCRIVIALDVSGSMVTTDEDRLSIEMIQMMIDLSSEEDEIAVVAYNDFIVYQSSLMPMDNKENKDKLKNDLNQLSFSGETDNGLGMKRAVDILAENTNASKKSYILFISDGKTDLQNSQSERTEQESENDWNNSAEIALEKGININTISFVNQYSQDTNQMTVISTKTGGNSSVVANPLQFMKAITQTWFSYKGMEDLLINTSSTNDQLQKLELDVNHIKTDEVLVVVVATEIYKDFEMVYTDNRMELLKNNHYAIAKIKNPVKETLYAMYSSESEGDLLWCLADVGKEEAVFQEPVEDEEEKTHAPVGLESTKEELYISKGKKSFDVSALFTDEDGDIVKYEIDMQRGAQLIVELKGTMLEVEPKADEQVIVTITATDAFNQKAQADMVFDCIPRWKEHYSLLVGMVIAAILALTGVACFVLYRFFFPKEEEKRQPFYGYLYATFIDLKSKNDIPRLVFDLRDYSNEGVTLKELMLGEQIQEDLPDIEKIFFSPATKNSIYLRHSSQGGVFVEDELLPKNKEIEIESGTTIYISFAENASEYELRYEAKGIG
ncbi:MAG: VWA domain-containing protein [Lachnospiraceae bacterium]|nr:VWA domain-containing protein [Lachnospiraceae bacterium]